MPVRYQVQFFGHSRSNLALAHGSTRSEQNSLNVGTVLFSRIPTSPFARDVRCAASICRATLSLPCLVDSRMSFPCHMNLYQYTPQEPRSPHLLHVSFTPLLLHPRL